MVQVYLSIVFNDNIEKHGILKDFKFISGNLICLYILVEVFFLIAIAILFVNFREAERSHDAGTALPAQLALIDKPPSYEDAVLSSVWAQYLNYS